MVRSIKYGSINVPSTNQWNVCYECRLSLKHVEIVIICLWSMQSKILEVGKWDWCYLMLWCSNYCLTPWNERKKIHILFLCRQLKVQSSTSLFVMLLEVLAMQRVYKYMKKAKNIPVTISLKFSTYLASFSLSIIIY